MSALSTPLQREHVEQRQHAQRAVAGLRREQVVGHVELCEHVAVRDHRALGLAGGARGVDGQDVLVALGRARRDRLRPRAARRTPCACPRCRSRTRAAGSAGRRSRPRPAARTSRTRRARGSRCPRPGSESRAAVSSTFIGTTTLPLQPRAVQRLGEVRDVRQHQADALAAFHAVRREPGRQLARVLRQRPVRDRLPMNSSAIDSGFGLGGSQVLEDVVDHGDSLRPDPSTRCRRV